MFVCLCYRLKEEDDIDGDGGEQTPAAGEPTRDNGETGQSPHCFYLTTTTTNDDKAATSANRGKAISCSSGMQLHVSVVSHRVGGRADRGVQIIKLFFTSSFKLLFKILEK